MAEERSAAPGVPDVTEVDEQVLRDLESRYVDVLCPVHGVAPKFEVQPDGSLEEILCCETLLRIFRELQVNEKNAAGQPEP